MNMNNEFIIKSFLGSKYWFPFNEKNLTKDLAREDLYDFKTEVDLIGYVKTQTKYEEFNKEEIVKLETRELEISNIFSKTFEKVFQILKPKGVQTVLLLPTVDKFVTSKMDGVVGYSPDKDVIFIYISPSFNEQALVETIAHEYNHSQYIYTTKIRSVLDGLIAEGFAEHFRLEVVGGEIAEWCKALNKEESFKVLQQLIKNNVLNETDYKVYSDIFTNPKSNYPHWAGYSIGYHLIDELKSQESIDWNNVLKEQPVEVFDKIKQVLK